MSEKLLRIPALIIGTIILVFMLIYVLIFISTPFILAYTLIEKALS